MVKKLEKVMKSEATQVALLKLGQLVGAKDEVDFQIEQIQIDAEKEPEEEEETESQEVKKSFTVG